MSAVGSLTSCTRMSGMVASRAANAWLAGDFTSSWRSTSGAAFPLSAPLIDAPDRTTVKTSGSRMKNTSSIGEET